MSGRVRIGTCSDPVDAAFIRSMFEARGISVVIGAEHHASLMGPILGAFLTLDIWVDRDDAAEATTLLRDLRERDPDVPAADAEAQPLASDGSLPPDVTAEADDDSDGDGDDAHWTRPTEHEDDTADDAGEPSSQALRERAYERRRGVIAVMSGLVITFGTAHMFTGAWLRGIALAGLELVGILHAHSGGKAGFAAIIASVALDVLGTIARLWARSRQHASAQGRAGQTPPAPPSAGAALPTAQARKP